MLSFNGKYLDPDIAAKLESEAYSFCREVDPGMPRNKGKSLPAKYKMVLPVAQWVKLAGDIAGRQCSLIAIKKSISERQENRQILEAENEQLETMLKDCKAQIADAQEAIDSAESLVIKVEDDLLEVDRIKARLASPRKERDPAPMLGLKQQVEEILTGTVRPSPQTVPRAIEPSGGDTEKAEEEV